MKKRIITAIIMGTVLLPAIIIPALKPVLEIIVFILLLCACYEVLHMYDQKHHINRRIKIVSTFFTCLIYFAVVDSYQFISTTISDSLICRFLAKFPYELNLTMVLIVVFIIMMFLSLVVKGFEIEDCGRIFLMMLYLSLTFASFTILRSYGVRFIVYMLLVTAFTDIFALVFGMKFGKHKLAPVVSPKKTWEGAIGGSLVATIIGFAFLLLYKYISPYFHEGQTIEFFTGVFSPKYVNDKKVHYVFFILILTVFMSCCGQIGDLVASKLKRGYGIKDYSNIFPGHGGVLDRFDSALFTSATFVAMIQLIAVVFSAEIA
ncbi:MAG: phosphatidate cytidylyltransferase [Acholeplasmatales bacterium]|nr:phosphatidate cytidylyltransferase [Acholeplasmatales bacterium]